MSQNTLISVSLLQKKKYSLLQDTNFTVIIAGGKLTNKHCKRTTAHLNFGLQNQVKKKIIQVFIINDLLSRS